MRILLASSEVHPYSKTGGLADMVGALGRSLVSLGHRVGLVTPLYLGIRERFPELKPLELPLDLPLGLRRVRGEIWTLDPLPGFTLYFIDQAEFYQRSTLYHKDGADYADNAERFIFFSKAVANLALQLPWKPQVLHLHDWQAAAAALFVRHQQHLAADGQRPRICCTVHNLAYQGVFPASQYALLNLPWDYFTPAAVEFYGQFNCLKAGLAFSDVLTTVSPRYAREITTEEFGCGLDGLLRRRQDALHGILNGVDYSEWNPASDPFIAAQYSLRQREGKCTDKTRLQEEFDLPVDPAVPVFGNIGRMVEQKGVDILLAALQEMLSARMQFVLLGTGTPAFQRAFLDLAKRFPHKAAVRIGFDEGLSHRIEAGCDFFLMPSRFEPCGLNQMYSLRYGTIPIVRAVGGLDDTVVDPREDTATATGIKFHEYSSRALAKAIRKALVLYDHPEALGSMQHNSMQADFSWDRTATEYSSVYHRLLK